MSRAVKDLRSLINISRLSIRSSDDEEASECVNTPLCSPDSGICAIESRPSSSDSLRSACKPLPSINRKMNSSKSMKHDLSPIRNTDTPVSSQNIEGNFERMLIYIDSIIVSNWLQKANQFIDELVLWFRQNDNFISFIHFWLSQFPDQIRANLFKSEYDILMQEMLQAFSTGVEDGSVERKHIRLFLSAVYREYPDKILCTRGKRLFLDQLRTLSCSKEEDYRHLLSDVKCKTNIKQHAQWILAARAYCLISTSHAVITFFINFSNSLPMSQISMGTHFNEARFQVNNTLVSISRGYAEVVQYLLNSGEMNIDWMDEQNKTLLFHAVINKQPKVLSLLLRMTKDQELINQRAVNGNTIMHAAINTGQLDLIEILLNCSLVDINSANKLCQDNTPLHVAVVYELVDAARLLIAKGADVTLKSADKTAKQLAEETNNPDLIQLFQTDTMNAC